MMQIEQGPKLKFAILKLFEQKFQFKRDYFHYKYWTTLQNPNHITVKKANISKEIITKSYFIKHSSGEKNWVKSILEERWY